MNCLRNHSPHIEGPTGCVYCYMEGLHSDADKQTAINAELLEALMELADLMDDIQAGDYSPDSFTTQPARAAIAKATGELK